MSVQRSRVGCQQGMFSSGNSLRFERRPSGIASPTLRTAALGIAPGALAYGQTFLDIEAYGVERWLDELAQELKSRLVVE